MTNEEKARVLDEVCEALIGTNRVATLSGVIPWLRDWADHLRKAGDGMSEREEPPS